jgi:hypothetical protein
MYGDYRAGQTAHALSAHIPQGGFPPEREGRGSRFGRTAIEDYIVRARCAGRAAPATFALDYLGRHPWGRASPS